MPPATSPRVVCEKVAHFRRVSRGIKRPDGWGAVEVGSRAPHRQRAPRAALGPSGPERNPAAGQRFRNFRHVVCGSGGRAYPNRGTAIAGLRRRKAMRQLLSSAVFILAIILPGVPASPQSVSSSQALANDLARRVITNELKFQEDHTNWMYRLDKQQYGK